jgi:hypothetical protein
MEKINVFIVALPTFESVVEKIKDAIEEKFEKPKCKKPRFCCDDFEEDEEDLTPPRFKNHSFMPLAPIPQWGIGGKPADENLRFGYGLEVDEPRRSDYDNFEDFEYDHQLYDEFVDAGESCRERGLDRRNNAPITKCNAIRKRLNEAPPMNLPLIGETDWWNEDDLDWDY